VSDARLPLTGGCGCGAVRFEVDAPPVEAGYCHCHRCQRRTGTAAGVSARLEPGSLRITSGEDMIRAWEPEGGNPKAYCAACGSGLWAHPPGEPEAKAVRMGAFDEDPGIRPSYHQWLDSAAPWEPIPDDGLPRYAGPRPRP
jgi:hypothetical protein